MSDYQPGPESWEASELPPVIWAYESPSAFSESPVMNSIWMHLHQSLPFCRPLMEEAYLI